MIQRKKKMKDQDRVKEKIDECDKDIDIENKDE